MRFAYADPPYIGQARKHYKSVEEVYSMTPLRIYIAGPLTATPESSRERNVAAAMVAAEGLLAKGHYPFIPHLTHFYDLLLPGLSYAQYLSWDKAWLDVSDALFFLGHSPGADKELRWAEKRGIPVYHNLQDVPESVLV